ncbi:Long-chain-fatty-acid--CoA ligase [Candidatus Magnetomoraceae bacterium gMMP-15]
MKNKIKYEDKIWFNHYPKGVPTNIEYKEIFVTDFLKNSAMQYPEKTALIFQGYSITYKQLNNMVDRFATCLHDFGIKKGDRVAVLLPNIIPCFISYYAILKLGAIVVMNNPLYSDRELKYQLNDSEAKIIITLDLLANRIINLRPDLKIKEIIYTTLGDYLPFVKKILFPLVAKKKKLAASVKNAPDVYKWKNLLAKYSPTPPDVDLSFDDIAMYQYTGGTTGISKGVILTHANLSKQIQQADPWFFAFSNGDHIALAALPCFHVFGMTAVMNFPIFKGWTIVLVPKPQPDPLLKVIQKYKPTFAPLVPTMFIGMLNHPEFKQSDLTSIKAFFSGSAPLPVEVINEFEEATGAVILEGFGLTEASPITHINPMVGTRKVGSIGIPIPDTECRIVDLEDDEKDVPVGKSGELLIKGPQVMQAYLNRPDETDAALKNGWLHTGDIAAMDEDGYFFIVDRKKDMIISGGFNIYPREIDEVFFENPKVKEAATIGIPHPTRVETPKVFVVLKKGEKTDKKELLDYCKDKLAKYKWPTEIEFRDELPKNNIGKILKKDLRKKDK